MSRWSRQTVLEEIGTSGQQKILDAKIAIVGMGGLGCPAAKSLVAAGAGSLNIIDGDRIELSYLHRQHMYSLSDVGKKKVTIAKRVLRKFSDKTKIKAYDFFLNDSNAADCFDDTHIIIDATYNISSYDKSGCSGRDIISGKIFSETGKKSFFELKKFNQ